MNQTTLVTYKLFWFTKIHFSKESFVSESYNTGSTVPLYVFIYYKELALKNNLFMNQTTLEMLVSAHRDNSEKNTFLAIIWMYVDF